MRAFLWCNEEYKRGRDKVAWDDICLPKCEGGLGLYSLELFNITLMTTHIWNIVSNKESLWVRWIHSYKLNGRSLWDIPQKADMSWGWLADLVENGAWLWPSTWLQKAHALSMVPAPHLDVNSWEAIRIRGNSIAWNHVVWFNHNIPRHAFHLWLIMRRSLKTQDRLRQWDVGPAVDLDLLVWNNIRHLAGMEQVQPVLHDIVNYLQPMANNRFMDDPAVIMIGFVSWVRPMVRIWMVAWSASYLGRMIKSLLLGAH
ncbi:reverse transcriptase domain-containing protein [Tanacetum coccineum]